MEPTKPHVELTTIEKLQTTDLTLRIAICMFLAMAAFCELLMAVAG